MSAYKKNPGIYSLQRILKQIAPFQKKNANWNLEENEGFLSSVLEKDHQQACRNDVFFGQLSLKRQVGSLKAKQYIYIYIEIYVAKRTLAQTVIIESKFIFLEERASVKVIQALEGPAAKMANFGLQKSGKPFGRHIGHAVAGLVL